MLTRFVRIQLVIFTVLSVIGVSTVLVKYMQAPTMLGLGKVTVTLQLPASGGLYPLANVTYRGVQVGKVKSISPTAAGAEAVLSLNTTPPIPADLRAEVRSISAIGEQYVELLPNSDTGGHLRDGSVIPVQDTAIPQPVGPMLDQASKLVASIPKDHLSQLLDETFTSVNGARYDLGSLLDSSSKLASSLDGASEQTRELIDDSVPLLDSQVDSADALRTWTHSLAGVTDQLVQNDDQLRTVLRDGPGAVREVSTLLEQLKPTLPILLANLNSVAQILVTYNPSLEQLFVLLPANVAATDSYALPQNNPTGWPLADFTITLNDPPPCTVGFLPPSEWRSPADTSEIDTPDGLYCKLPQDSPISVRGARNAPCMDKPGKRAPTVEICDSDQPYRPLAMRQHALGPYPIDPNLIAVGIPPDGRVNRDSNIFGPLSGTPPPDAAPPAGPADGSAPAAPADGSAPAAPAGMTDHAGSPRPAVSYLPYDPATGRYLTPGGELEQQSNLAPQRSIKTWQDLMPT